MTRFRDPVWGAFGGAGLALAASVLPAGVPFALAALGVLVLPVALWLGGREGRERFPGLLPLFLGAVVVRVGVALFAHYATPHGFFALDDGRYDLIGWQIARHWAGEAPRPDDLHGPAGYYLWNALLYTEFGHRPLVPAVTNAAVGGYVTILAFALARPLGGSAAGRWAAGLTAFWPSLVLWSSLNLKDAAAILAILLLLRGAQRLRGSLDPLGLVQATLGLGMLSELRFYLMVVAAGAFAVGFVLPRLRGRGAPALVALLVLGATVALPALGPVNDLRDEANLQLLTHARHELAFGGSAYYGDADVSTPARAARFLPVGLAYFLLAPAPWQLWNARQVLTLPEMLAWYALLPLVAFGLFRALRKHFAEAVPIALFALFASVSYALVESNLGTAYRHRAQVLVLFLIFGAVGLVERRARRRDWAAGVAPHGVPA